MMAGIRDDEDDDVVLPCEIDVIHFDAVDSPNTWLTDDEIMNDSVATVARQCRHRVHAVLQMS